MLLTGAMIRAYGCVLIFYISNMWVGVTTYKQKHAVDISQNNNWNRPINRQLTEFKLVHRTINHNRKEN